MKAKWFWISLLCITCVQAVFSLAFAFTTPGIPTSDEQAFGLVDSLWKVLVDKNWAMAAGPALALIVFALRKWDTKIPKYGAQIDAFLNKPFVAFLLPTIVSAAGGLGTALAAGKPPLDALKAVFEASMSAVFSYVGLKKLAEQQTVGKEAAAAVDSKAAAIDELKKP